MKWNVLKIIIKKHMPFKNNFKLLTPHSSAIISVSFLILFTLNESVNETKSLWITKKKNKK